MSELENERSDYYVANESETDQLARELRRAIEELTPKTVLFATGFFSAPGFALIKNSLVAVDNFRLLLGMKPIMKKRGPGEEIMSERGGSGPSEAIQLEDFLEGKYPWLLKSREERKQLADTGYIPLDPDYWELVKELVEFLQRDTVEVRRFLGQSMDAVVPDDVLTAKVPASDFLHAKAYIFPDARLPVAYVGSSNLTYAGLTRNRELNLVTVDPLAVKALDEEWFAKRWGQGMDCKPQLIRMFEDSALYGKRYTPWHVYIKVLYETYKDYLEGALSERVALGLAEFQKEAARRALKMLEESWGCFICDAVGLGKTYTGLAILQEWRNKYPQSRTLVVCPAQLAGDKGVWNEDRLKNLEILGSVLTMESLPRLVPDAEELDAMTKTERGEMVRDLRNYQKSDIILVDESHNFRNPATKRYKALMRIIREGKPNKRVVLMTATPINNSLLDYYHQLSLITREQDDWYSAKSENIKNLLGFFRRSMKEGGSGFIDLLLMTCVRRNRADIRKRLERGEKIEIKGQRLRFPERDIPKAVEYSLEDSYGHLYKEIAEKIDGLNLASYNLDQYVKGKKKSEEAQVQVKRNEALIALIKMLYLKRLESSVKAFKSSLEAQKLYQQRFLKYLAKNQLLRATDSRRITQLIGGFSADESLEDVLSGKEELEGFIEGLPKIYAKEYDLKVLREMTDEDVRTLDELAQMIDKVMAQGSESKDPKIEALKALLSGPLAGRKVVIFTNYADTANYLFKELSSAIGVATIGGLAVKCSLDDRNITKLTGSDPPTKRRQVLLHFAPRATLRTEIGSEDEELIQHHIEECMKEPIDILISTDVLSEGQNLQDAAHLINYDLHWNPVRMIQRGGRIDRLGSPHPTVHIYNFFPEAGLEQLLHLMRKLAKKIADIDSSVGLDSSVLGEQVNEKAIDQMMRLRAGGAEANEIYTEYEKEADLDNFYADLQKFLDLVVQFGTEKARELPLGIHSVKQSDVDGVFIGFKTAAGSLLRVYFEGDDLKVTRKEADAYKVIGCDESQERMKVTNEENPFKVIKPYLEKFFSEIRQGDSSGKTAEELHKTAKDVKNMLVQNDLFLELDKDVRKRLSEWVKRRGSKQIETQARLREIRSTYDAEQDGIAFLTALDAFLREGGYYTPIAKPEFEPVTKETVTLIAFELLKKPPDAAKRESSGTVEEHEPVPGV